MPTGTFNLNEFFRRMGIKNPRTTVEQSAQPVIVVGDFSALTPQLVPPTWIGGAVSPAVAGEFSWVQIISIAPGGTNLLQFVSTDLKFGLVAARLVGGTNVPDRGPFSNEISEAVVEFGSQVVEPLLGTNFPFPPELLRTVWPGPAKIFIPPGRVLVFQVPVANTSSQQFMFILQDVPATELPVE